MARRPREFEHATLDKHADQCAENRSFDTDQIIWMSRRRAARLNNTRTRDGPGGAPEIRR